ncbi:LytTR family DNA-binding domain-containing protein [Eubacterium sp. 1001713B170207_170306_E7]|uniref:LytTR family DNA-binding domain-containing protein n=1 Tax=Eubacterium sp. 1001713B170207_170306_E7 TaxID=2787097 RepID=UPI0018988F36|nr:LytTR family DNA-binding domain-containing protein [Eubacterium sp. 1001713B170207_170306_E7]
MLRIAICDDEDRKPEQRGAQVPAYAWSHPELNITCCRYGVPEGPAAAPEQETPPDLYLLNIEDNRRLLLPTHQGLNTLPFYQIIYVESYRHRFSCGLLDGRRLESTTRRESFRRFIAPLLDDDRFVQTSASHAVNMQHIRTITREGFCMKDGTTVPVTRTFSGARQAYRDYLAQKD